MRRINLAGEKFGKLRVQECPEKRGKEYYWNCLCECGKSNMVVTGNLRSGHTTSCGCVQKERTAIASKTHGMSKTKTYKAYRKMIERCYNAKDISFKNWGARGITVCARWRASFDYFFSDMGECPQGFSLERVNVEDSYYKENCRWIPRSQQARNTRKTRFITWNSRTQILQDWANETGLSPGCIVGRIDSGWSLDKVFTEKVQRRTESSTVT